jgi:hypothetical protein
MTALASGYKKPSFLFPLSLGWPSPPTHHN